MPEFLLDFGTERAEFDLLDTLPTDLECLSERTEWADFTLDEIRPFLDVEGFALPRFKWPA